MYTWRKGDREEEESEKESREKDNSQRLNRRSRGLVLVTSWSKRLIFIKVCRGYISGVRAPEEAMHTEACTKQCASELVDKRAPSET